MEAATGMASRLKSRLFGSETAATAGGVGVNSGRQNNVTNFNSTTNTTTARPGNMVGSEPAVVDEADFHDLKSRCKLIFEADPEQYHSDQSLQRFLRAFLSVDAAFHAILKCNKWRREFGVTALTAEQPDIKGELDAGKAVILKHRDMCGRPVIYIPARKHNVNEREVEVLTKFIVYILETACRRCEEEVIDNLCIVFDLKEFGMANMDYEFVKKLIWLLSKYFPERLGVCLIINAPTLFSGCWAVIRNWLNEVTASKVTFVKDATDLCQYLHPIILPEGACILDEEEGT